MNAIANIMKYDKESKLSNILSVVLSNWYF